MRRAGGSPTIMARMTGVSGNYIVRAIRGQINISWKKADLLRAARKETPMTTTANVSNLENLHPSMREAVQKLIHQGKLVECSHCHEFFARDLQHRTYCPACKRAGNTNPTPVPGAQAADERQADTSTTRTRSRRRSNPIHSRPLIDCGNPECTRRLRDWGGRKYCEDTCKHRAATLRKAQDEPQAPQTEAPTQRIKGEYVAFAGAPCHREGCEGTFELKTNHRNGHKFYGCSWFRDENRPPRTDKCRATAVYASNVDGKALYTGLNGNGTTLHQPAAPSKDIAERILTLLNHLDTELKDAIGRIADLERLVTHGNEAVAKLRQDVSDIHFNTEELHKALTQ